jgi:uncharacterized protein
MGFSACGIEHKNENENENDFMPIIDAHVHLYPPEINRDPAGWATAAGESHWATLCTRRRINGQPVQAFPTLDELLRAMDRVGVERSILLGWYWERPESCRIQNRFYAQCIAPHPDRLTAFASIHPKAGAEAVRQEMEFARAAGFAGLGELSPHSEGVAVDDPVLAAILKRAGEWGWPVNLHVTDPDSRSYPGRVMTPLADFLELARSHDQTKFILAHWGGRLPLVTKHPIPTNIYYDTAASPLLYPQTFWREFCAEVAPDRVLFGSDYPLNLYPAIDSETDMSRLIAEVHRSELSAAALQAVVHDNATALLRG